MNVEMATTIQLQKATSLRARKILIVDDDRALVDLISFAFQREGFDVIHAEDGKAALRSWCFDQPDLIVLDVNLPGMDGFSICRLVREESCIPILMLSIRGNEDDIINGLDLGADDYIIKPFSMVHLVARAQGLLRRWGQAHSKIS